MDGVDEIERVGPRSVHVESAWEVLQVGSKLGRKWTVTVLLREDGRNNVVSTIIRVNRPVSRHSSGSKNNKRYEPTQ